MSILRRLEVTSHEINAPTKTNIDPDCLALERLFRSTNQWAFRVHLSLPGCTSKDLDLPTLSLESPPNVLFPPGVPLNRCADAQAGLFQ